MTLDDFAKTILPQKWYRQLYLYRHIYKLTTRKGSYLVETGYINSIKRFAPVNKSDEPIPWMNYSFIDFLEPRLNSFMKVFEYGCGYSTLYLAEKVKSVVSIEHDKAWYDEMSERLNNKNNSKIFYYPSPQQYQVAIKEHAEELYDLIVVDGRDREECVKHIIPYLTEGGVVILDDSRREKFDEIFDLFKNNGFRYLSFSGIKAGGMIVEETTVFYRDHNILGI